MLRTRLASGILTFAAGAGAVAAIQPILATQDMPQPGEYHRMLQKDVGTYEGTMTMSMPGMELEPAPAKETIRPLGGFWTISHFECEYMGMPMQGQGVMGYDPDKKKFVGTWIDSFTPSLSVMEGEYDEAKKAIVMDWMAKGMTGEMVPHRMETVHTADGYVMEMFIGEGDLAQSMKIAMKRTSKAVEAGADK